MAVEIPVVIDIEKAFDDAARRVDAAMRPLQRRIENSTSSLKLKIGVVQTDGGTWVNVYETLEKIITRVTKNMRTGTAHMTYGVKELSTALEYAKERLTNLNAAQQAGVGANPVLVNSYREAISVLTAVIEQRTHEADLVSRTAASQVAALRAEEQRRSVIAQEATTIAQMADKVSALREQLQNLNPKSKEWSAAAKEIIKATEALGKYEAKLAIATTKSGSINRMTAELSALEQKWASMPRTQKFDKNGEYTSSAQRLINKYRELSQAAAQYGQTLSQIIQRKPGLDSMNNSLRTQGGLLRSLASYASMYFSVFGLMRFVNQIRTVTGELEYQRVALGHLLQDEEYGAQLFNRIKNLAIESPFRIQQLVTYTKQLAAYRIAQEDLYDTTKRLADISAGLGVDMNRLILAYGQVRAASVLRGQELRQFTEAGLPLVDQLAEKFTELKGEMVSTADVFKLISERAVPFSMIAEIFEDLTDKGGMFYNMQAKQAETLKGRWEKLKDAYDIGLQSIGESKGLLSFNTYMETTLKVLNFFAKNLRIIPKLIEGGTAAILLYNIAIRVTGRRIREVVSAETQLVVAQRLSNMGVKEGAWNHRALTAALIAEQNATNGLTRSFARLRIAMLSNPWIAAGAAVAGLVLSFVSFRKNIDDTANSLSDLERVTEKVSGAVKEAAKEAKLIDKYEKLASMTERTTKENVSFIDTVYRLKEAFPNLVGEIDNENVALGEQIRLLREASGLQLEEAKKGGENRLALEKQTLKDMIAKQKSSEKEYSDLYKAFFEAQRRQEMGAEALNEMSVAAAQAVSEAGGNAAYKFITQESLDRALKKATDALNKAVPGWDELKTEIEKKAKGIEALEKALYPEAAESDFAEWQKQLKLLQESMLEVGDTPVFTGEDIENMTNVYDLSKKLKSKMKELEESLSGMKEMYKAMLPGEAKDSVAKDIAALEKTLSVAKAIQKLFGFTFASGDGYTADPFIAALQNRMAFMKDFKKGYEDLAKYMGKAGALSKESEIMLSRGLSLGIDSAEQKRAAENLSMWYSDAIDEAFAQAKKHGARGTVSDFLSQQINGSSSHAKALRDFQKLIQSLWDAKTTLDTSEMTQTFEEAFKQIKQSLKQSETIRNFYNDLLSATGNKELAATLTFSVYGDGDIQGYSQSMQQSLNEILEQLSNTPGVEISEDMREAFEKQDFDYILKNMSSFSDKAQEALRDLADESQKHNASWISDLVKTYHKEKTFEQRETEVTERETQKRIEIEEWKRKELERISKEYEGDEAEQKRSVIEKEAVEATAASRKKEAEEIAKIELEAMQATYSWTKAFEDMDNVSTATLKNLKKLLTDYLETAGKDATPEDRKTVTQSLEQVEQQLLTRSNSYRQLAKDLGAYMTARKDANKYEREGKTDTDEYRKAADKMRKSQTAIQTDVENISSAFSQLGDIVSSVSEILQLDDLSDGQAILNGIASGISLIGKGLAAVLAVVILLNTMSPALLAISAGLAAVASAFTIATNIKVAKANREIERQEDLLKNLESEYERLEKAIEEAFGSDYVTNYESQRKNLTAQMAAYQAMVDAEKSKGKKTDDDKLEEYGDKITDIKEQLREMESSLSEHFLGSDLTSTARDFAQAWIDAYQEFSSTTSAMKEKFADMIDNMVVESLAGAVMQKILQPIFDEVDRLSAEGGNLDEADIAKIAEMSTVVIDQANTTLSSLMSNLAAAGINMRATDASLSGISKDVASASEESINALAAGINTQNFYMSYMPTISSDVAAIRAALVGSAASAESAVDTPATASQFGDETFRGQMQRMDENIAELTAIMRSVRTPKSANTNTHCIAVK